MAAPLSFLRPSAARVLERLPLTSSAAKKAIASRRCLSTFAPRPSHIGPTSSFVRLCQRRPYSTSNEEPPRGPNQGQLPHITEETNQIAEIMGEEGVNVDEVATPISEIIERENDVENAPEVIKEDLRSTDTASASLLPLETLPDFPNPTPKVMIPPYRPPMPLTPIPALHSIHHRQHPLLRQLTPHFMQHGELATAQATIQKILQILRTKPAPRVGKYPLVPNAPDLSLLPSDPVAYLQTAIDSVAPLFKMKSTRGSGGSTVQIPAPLNVKVRRRRAMEWMMAAADGKKRMKPLAERFAEEVEAVVLGTSSCWDKRVAVHKLAVTNRANVSQTMGKKGGARKRMS
ncbi:hypothetical protein H072_2619 [Dactylellina haptotyla CBS 200.50]|uniref:Small ribosomal subunit protein uS7 domain-containing protein n=1 Tax=Dactylellina haptotyla (strain CBS 200.50) TaxID=1284197 RepID=S8C6S8_DACHA|nr:hypothetical protein H072_2619 [Dactylellina haptotyla CBS 200.50]